MRFALVEDIKTEASFGKKGICPGCSQPVIAKCGEKRINHWAHTQKRSCDNWWEPETEWHRNWKNNFPPEWQEIFLPDEKTGEKHIADVRTSYGLVIEFQHSHINPKERISRERFYGNMIWVVDGTRLKRDFPRFLNARKNFAKYENYYTVDFPDECFPSSWLESSAFVFFDFKGLEVIEDQNDLRNYIYCLFPSRNKDVRRFIILTREQLISKVISGELFQKKVDTQSQSSTPISQNGLKRNIAPSHYYDPQKGRFIRRKRL